MPTSAVGNKPLPPRVSAGFTLIELMVVVALIAIASAGVSLSLRDSADTALERDAQRLAAVLEATRAQARVSESRALWLPREGGFEVQGLPMQAPKLQAWLSPDTRAQINAPLELGPEPLIGPQHVLLYSAQQPQRRLWLVSDGLRPFALRRSPPAQHPALEPTPEPAP